MERHEFHHDGLRFSYLDSAGDGPVLVALHAHFMEAATYIPLAAALSPDWRVVALDQRGHGDSGHAPTYTRDDYLADLGALLEHLGLDEVVLLGNSLGGVNAYQFAARHPGMVRGLIVEDIGVEMRDDLSFVLAWEGRFATREALVERVGPRLLPSVADSFRHFPDGWGLAFDPRDIVESGRCLAGNYWADWLATTCPTLLLRGRDSRMTTKDALEAMAARRPNTSLRVLDGGHILHVDDPSGFTDAVREFLRGL